MAKAKKPAATITAQPRTDVKGWVLCPGDNVLIVSPGEEYHGLFGKVDSFPTKLELSSYVHIDGRPSTSGRVLLPNAQLRWMGPDEERLDMLRPTRPGQQVRVVLDNEAEASAELKELEGQLGTVTELNGDAMFTVKFERPDLAPWPAAIHRRDLLVVPIPVVHYVPEPEPAAEVTEVRLSTRAWDFLEKVEALGGSVPHANVSNAQSQSCISELEEAGMLVEDDYGFRLTDAGTLAIQQSMATLADEPTQEEEQATGFRLLPLASIGVVRNTRKVFDEAALAELAESIKAHGILQPLVVRPAAEGGQFELVAGERRYRAAGLAGLEHVPAMVRTLTDREFLEVQLLENLQRVDVRPADEASAFSQLLANGFSAEEIGQRVGKAPKFVLQRAKLTSLIPFWQLLLEGERLPLVAAHELARLPAHSQVVVKKYMEEYRGYELRQTGLLDASTIRHAITQQVTRQLNSAAFPKDDATLCPQAGACTACPKNSANHRGLFDDLIEAGKPATCLDGACFATKISKFVERRKKEVAGSDVVLVSSSYDNPPKGALGYKHYDRSKEGEKGAVRALLVDGSEAGVTTWVKLGKGAASAQDVATNAKAEREAAIYANRVKKMENELLAKKLSDTFRGEMMGAGFDSGDAGARALLSHWLRRAFTFGRTRTPNDTLAFLVAEYGWEQPTEADLDNHYVSNGDNPHDQYINRQLAAMPSVMHLVGLFFDLKIRDGLEQTEYTSNQANLVKALPASYQKGFNVSKEAEKRVAERYGKKQKAIL